MFSGHSPVPSTKSGYNLSDDAIKALQSGDIDALMAIKRAQFGGYFMEHTDDGDDDEDDSGDGGDTGDSGAGGDNGDDDDDSSGDDGKDTVSKADFDALMKRMKAADQRAAAAEKKIKEADDAKKDDLTKASERVTELEAEAKEKDTTISSLRLQIAFLSANKNSWHKPGTALRIAQAEGYLDDVMNDAGEVDNKAMGSALDKLAKEHAYLVKTGDGGSGASGGGAGGRSDNGKDDKAIKTEDRRRAPALGRRGR